MSEQQLALIDGEGSWLTMARAIGEKVNGLTKIAPALARREELFDERKAAVRAILRANPYLAGNAIGDILKVAPVEVEDIRESMIAAGEISDSDVRIRSDGRPRSIVEIVSATLPEVVEPSGPGTAIVLAGRRRPPIQKRAEILLFADRARYTKESTSTHRSKLNWISRRIFNGVDCDSDFAYWEEFVTQGSEAGAAIKRVLTNPNEPNPLEDPGQYYNVFLLLAERMQRIKIAGKRIISADELEDLRAEVFSKKREEQEGVELPSLDELASIVAQYDLDTVKGWQHLFWFAMSYPVGLRNGTILEMKKSRMDTLDDGWLNLWRPKGDGVLMPAFINPYEGVKAIIRKWMSLIPEDSIDCLSFANERATGRILWDERVASQSSIGNVFRDARRAAGIPDERKITGNRGRHLVETRGAMLPSKAINSHLSHRKDKIDKHYIKAADPGYMSQFKDLFKDTPELMAIDGMLLNLVRGYMSDAEVARAVAKMEVEPRNCWNCRTDISGMDKRAKVCKRYRCQQAKKMKARRWQGSPPVGVGP